MLRRLEVWPCTPPHTSPSVAPQGRLLNLLYLLNLLPGVLCGLCVPSAPLWVPPTVHTVAPQGRLLYLLYLLYLLTILAVLRALARPQSATNLRNLRFPILAVLPAAAGP